MTNPIAYGRRSKVYQKDNTVVKMYDSSFPREKIEAEYTKALTIWDSQKLHVPKPISIIEERGQLGIEFEYINGIALMDLFQKKPWLYFSYTKLITTIHKEVHKNTIENIPNQQDEFTALITESTRLDISIKDKLLRILNKPYTPVLCHGDFHHGNLIKTPSNEIYIIDWMDAFVGSYKLDVALTAVNAQVSTAPNHVPVIYRNLYEFLKKVIRLDKRYLKLYGENDYAYYIYLAAGIHLARAEENNFSQHTKYLNSIS